MKPITFFQISLVTFALAFLSCSNLGLDQNKEKKDQDKKKCNSAVAAYIGCTASNSAMGACDSLYLGFSEREQNERIGRTNGTNSSKNGF
ncbi:hypothetical protein, partial [Leptospira adleri]|uniref:hypothetical protein n=1 Tax=Leptospira adleri TaxID=2023186 RepID=UPI001FAECFF5